ncbi:MAG TPA: hypothetical protein VMC05_15430, partial [Xanthobacteraceae bacterium]|nr:hypothetical protein [Xanthobacteraceae bacterium]
QCLTNLDLLPPTGALVIAAPLKIKEGSGSPLRVLALVPAPENGPRKKSTAKAKPAKPTKPAKRRARRTRR